MLIKPLQALSVSACLLSAGLLAALPISAQNSPTGNTPSMPGGTLSSPGGSMSSPGGMMSAPSRSQSSQLSNQDRQFIMKAAQSDMTEIMTSQLALKRSQNAGVRQYAQHMIKQHTNSTAKLKPIAQKKGVALPKDANAEGKALLAQLTKLSGTKFDQAYMSGQVRAHAKTNAEFQKEIQQGQDRDVIAFANQIQPIVAEHLQMAQSMVAKR